MGDDEWHKRVHDELTIKLQHIEDKLEAILGFHNKILGMAIFASLFASIITTIVVKAFAKG